MKQLFAIAVLALAAVGLVGCPASTQQKVAQAAQTASIVVVNFQTAEIASYQQGLISPADHQFIEQELGSVAVAGKALDSCIATATNTTGDLACIQTATTAINTINNQGGLGIKSATAKQEFQAAMTAFNTSLATITALLGGAK